MKFLAPPMLAISLAISLATAHADTFGSGENSFDIDFVTIGNAGNEDDPSILRGSVGYTYRMGVNEVSRGMIEAYNNTQGSGPTLTLQDMTAYGGNGANRPATGVSWNEAARFVNWLNTSQGHAPAYNFTTGGANDSITLWQEGESGYNANNPLRNSNAHYFLPSVDEWYKAAYYDPDMNNGAGGYWVYSTGSHSAPLSTSGGTDPGTVVYRLSAAVGPADITNAGGLSPYGTMAQGGNAWEWAETLRAPASSDERFVAGGSWINVRIPAIDIRHLTQPRDKGFPDSEILDWGFRVAAVPEPSSFLLSLLGAMGLMLRRRR